MARVKQFDVITGSISNLSFYTRKGSDQVFVRTKGGATKSQIKRRPEFANTRRNNMEFGGCSKMSKEIRQTFTKLAHVADYNLAPALCSVAKNIQKEDTESEWGERSIHLSKFRQYLVGFDFNRNTRFDSILRIQMQNNIDRATCEAVVDIPAFACSLGLYMPGKYSLFRLGASLGIATDHRLNDKKYSYEQIYNRNYQGYDTVYSSWYSTQATIPEQQLKPNVLIPNVEFVDDDSFILSIAIEFGTLDAFGNPVAIKYAGAGKILGVK